MRRLSLTCVHIEELTVIIVSPLNVDNCKRRQEWQGVPAVPYFCPPGNKAVHVTGLSLCGISIKWLHERLFGNFKEHGEIAATFFDSTGK